MAGDDIAEVLLVSERQEKRSSPDQQQPGVEPGKASGVGENCSRVGPSRAASQASSPRRTPAERDSESPGDVKYQVITGAMVGVVREQAQAEQHRTAAALEEARGELDRLRAAEAEHARQADALRAELADAVAARERAEHDSRQVRARVETAESHATTARQETSEARLALAAAQAWRLLAAVFPALA
uniref:hypothetical protein n=1 Tax=Nonomuraea bangladeshensis TaxID=404385 RepID=UPI003F49AD23